MRKEVIFAIIIGLILGGVIIFGLQIANKSSQQASSIITTPTPISNQTTPTPSITPSNQNLTVSSPTNNSVVSIPSVKIVGRTYPNSSVAIYNDIDEQLIQSGPDGAFNADLNLQGGENLITITSQSESQTANLKITVIYTTAKID